MKKSDFIKDSGVLKTQNYFNNCTNNTNSVITNSVQSDNPKYNNQNTNGNLNSFNTNGNLSTTYSTVNVKKRLRESSHYLEKQREQIHRAQKIKSAKDKNIENNLRSVQDHGQNKHGNEELERNPEPQPYPEHLNKSKQNLDGKI